MTQLIFFPTTWAIEHAYWWIGQRYLGGFEIGIVHSQTMWGRKQIYVRMGI
jgi:hypothetical protein